MTDLGVTKLAHEHQGFVLSDGSYATREQAYVVALASGQLQKPTHYGYLFSEDLW